MVDNQAMRTLEEAFARLPDVANLRGTTPAEMPAGTDSLVKSKSTLVEAPLDSPEPWGNIETVRNRMETRR